VRDFLHVEDVAEAVWAIARSPVTGAVNVGSGEPVTVRELVETIATIVGRPDLLEFGAIPERPNDPQIVCADNRRLREECAWHRRRSHVEGLRDTIEWWRNRTALHVGTQ